MHMCVDTHASGSPLTSSGTPFLIDNISHSLKMFSPLKLSFTAKKKASSFESEIEMKILASAF